MQAVPLLEDEWMCGTTLIFRCTVQGHAGKFVFGQIGPQKTPIALLVGRAQYVTLALMWCGD